jgi:hypothetical protein
VKAIADTGSTLSGLSLPILGILVSVVLIFVFVVLPLLREAHEARRDKRKFDDQERKP